MMTTKKLETQLKTLANMNHNATDKPNPIVSNPSAPTSGCDDELQENQMNQIKGESNVTNY